MTTTNLLLLLPVSENIGHHYERELAARFPSLRIDCAEHASKIGPFIADTEIILTFSPFINRTVAEQAPNLKWIQVLGSGVDGVVDLPLPDGAIITNGHGFQAIPVSEAALSMMFAASRGLPRQIRNQQEQRWERFPSSLLHGKKVGIIGIGAIAEMLAAKCAALGMSVIGVSSTPRAVKYFDRIYSKNQILEAASAADFLVILTPHTAETHHSVNEAILSAMKPTAFLVNVARGGVVDEAALMRVLERGEIAGAALDVFETQPLPAGHPLWSMPNVLISPHMAGLNDSYSSHIMPLLDHNLRHFLAGDIAGMRNLIRRTAAQHEGSTP